MEAKHKAGNYPTVSEVREELKALTNIGFPIFGAGVMDYIKNMATVACMGRLGSAELAGGALAIGFTNITGYSVLSGLASGIDPICSQAFGSNNSSLVNSIVRRSIVMLLLVSVLIGLLWINAERILLLLCQDPEIARMAGLYCSYALPDLAANSFLHPLRVYLRSRGTTWPLMWCSSLVTSAHILLVIFLSFTLELGLSGVAMSAFIANFISVFFLLIFLLLPHTDENAPLHLKTSLLSLEPRPVDPTPHVMEAWRTLLGLAITSCLGVCLEWWWYEFMTISAGYLQNARAALATAAIVIQTTSLLYTVPNALSASVSSRVGNELGAGRPAKARLATTVAISLAIMASLLGLVATSLGRRTWGRVFTVDSDVLRLTTTVLPLIGLCELGNCPQTTGCGVLRGSARPCTGASINLCSFYGVGAPVALFLAFTRKMGFQGLCYGLLAAQVVCAVSVLVAVYQTDWEEESVRAMELVSSDAAAAVLCLPQRGRNTKSSDNNLIRSLRRWK
ncbi:hypothetical protein MLD38_010715 [Melastoma candidum]|uniref:Uncharacterized protein n=1 Tax=Melastoma candidum TaxID=119954 RepID=A0ACB9R0R2_9MYRT|nr:hypothetical protein MLD38_010715 [Melastoma candidum]